MLACVAKGIDALQWAKCFMGGKLLTADSKCESYVTTVTGVETIVENYYERPEEAG